MLIKGQGRLSFLDFIKFGICDPIPHFISILWVVVYTWFLSGVLSNWSILSFSLIDLFLNTLILLIVYILLGGFLAVYSKWKPLKLLSKDRSRLYQIHKEKGILVQANVESDSLDMLIHWKEITSIRILPTCIKLVLKDRQPVYIPLRFFSTENIRYIRNNLILIWQEQRVEHVEEDLIVSQEGTYTLEGDISFWEFAKNSQIFSLANICQFVLIISMSLILILNIRKSVDRIDVLILGVVLSIVFIIGGIGYALVLYYKHHRWISPIRAVLSKDDIHVQHVNSVCKSSQRFRWEDVHSLYIRKKTAYIITTFPNGHFLPLHSLPDEEYQAVLHLLKTKQHELKSHKKKK